MCQIRIRISWFNNRVVVICHICPEASIRLVLPVPERQGTHMEYIKVLIIIIRLQEVQTG